MNTAQNPQTIPQLPIAFFAQLLARIKLDSPTFYVLIQKGAIWLTTLSSVLGIIVFILLPTSRIAVPAWLSSSDTLIAAIVGLLAGVGLGGAGVASTTIKTPSTPDLAVDAPKVSLEDRLQEMASRLAAQDTEIAQLKAVQPKAPSEPTVDPA